MAGVIALAASLVQADQAAGTLKNDPQQAPGHTVTSYTVPHVFDEFQTFTNTAGTLANYLEGGPQPTAGHPFFEPLGTNGRTCLTCHQPANAMGLSVDNIRSRYVASAGKDPLFDAYDGANCPNAVRDGRYYAPDDPANPYSMLLKHGLIRIPRPWPPRNEFGQVVKPEFDIEVVSDPTGCNTDPVFGLRSAQPTISVFRRPLPVANLRLIDKSTTQFGQPFDVYMQLRPINPATGEAYSGNILSDGRALTLEDQALDAIMGHLQAAQKPTAEQLAKIVDFEKRLFSAQLHDNAAGDLNADGALGGPRRIATLPAGQLEVDGLVMTEFNAWKNDRSEARQSILRGQKIFNERKFIISNMTAINDSAIIQYNNQLIASCSNCHDHAGTGTETFSAALRDLGLHATHPTALPMPDLPLFKLTCRGDAAHPYLGKIVTTTDPGYALVSGKCRDIAKTRVGQMRGMAARAPYFVNGSARTIEDLVVFYDERLNMQLSRQERKDLAAFLNAL